MARRTKDNAVDWNAIERTYRLGKKSNKQLGADFDVDHSSIGRRAKKFGWVVDKSEEVDAVTNSLLIQAASGNANPNATPSALEIKAAGQTNADVVLNQRVGLRRLGALRDGMLDHMEGAVAHMPDLADLIEQMRNPDDNGQDRVNDRMRKALGRSDLIDDLKKLAEIDEKVRKGENEAFGIGKDKGLEPWEDLLQRLGTL